MDLRRQCKFLSYKYSLRFRPHYEVEIQALMMKNYNKKSRLKAYEDIVTILKKYQEVPCETAQIEPKQVAKDTYLSHPNLEVQKFVIDTIWRRVNSYKKKQDFIFNPDNYIKLWALITQEEEKDIEIVMEKPLMKYNSCASKKCKKKETVRIDDVQIKNVIISNFDNVLWNSIEKLYRVNKDFVRLSDKLESDIGSVSFRLENISINCLFLLKTNVRS
ncbi:MAG: hypothetical protein EZS28_014611 [Streblomastix strix]|uniref:Uncharacterized protein n=1 Tax=Streblomastix strix TaxID=222440 RepID=A0A5J4W594_9EUKA|nr:MAG: hypothetical protein EZS28_014611 [Streblomastix strix]